MVTNITDTHDNTDSFTGEALVFWRENLRCSLKGRDRGAVTSVLGGNGGGAFWRGAGTGGGWWLVATICKKMPRIRR